MREGKDFQLSRCLIFYRLSPSRKISSNPRPIRKEQLRVLELCSIKDIAFDIALTILEEAQIFFIFMTMALFRKSTLVGLPFLRY